jgi:hypothetical protein
MNKQNQLIAVCGLNCKECDIFHAPSNPEIAQEIVDWLKKERDTKMVCYISNMTKPPLNEIFKYKDKKAKDQTMYGLPPVRLYPKRYSRICWRALCYSEQSH